MPQEEISRIQPDVREFELTQASSTNDSPLPFAMQDGRTAANCPPATGHFPRVNPSNRRPDCALRIPSASNASGDNRKIHFALFGANDHAQVGNLEPSGFFLKRASLLAFSISIDSPSVKFRCANKSPYSRGHRHQAILLSASDDPHIFKCNLHGKPLWTSRLQHDKKATRTDGTRLRSLCHP